jgi:hypothetical protein
MLQIVANFGATPFKGDVDSIMASASLSVEQRISSSVIPADKKVGCTICRENHLSYTNMDKKNMDKTSQQARAGKFTVTGWEHKPCSSALKLPFMQSNPPIFQHD